MDTTESTERRTVAQVIRGRMFELDLSESAMAEAIPMPRVTLRRHLQRGGEQLSLADLKAIAGVLRLPLAQLVDDTDGAEVGAR